MSLTQNLVRINMQRGRKCGSPRLKFHLLLAVYAQDTADAPAEKNRRKPRAPPLDGKRSLIHHQGTRPLQHRLPTAHRRLPARLPSPRKTAPRITRLKRRRYKRWLSLEPSGRALGANCPISQLPQPPQPRWQRSSRQQRPGTKETLLPFSQWHLSPLCLFQDM